MHNIIEKIKNRTANVAVIGLGYVGLPLAMETAKAGFNTTGIDLAVNRVESLNEGRNYIVDVDDEDLINGLKNNKFRATTEFNVLAEIDAISICVPTPLGKGKSPDMSFMISAVEQVAKFLRPGQLVVLESTTYPGTTDEVVLPLLAESGLVAGEDYYLAFSPERIDPGNSEYGLKNTPKIIGGLTRNCTEIAQALYETFINKVIPVSSTRTAEMVKLLENTFRAINIGLANEVAIMCNHLEIDTWEVIEAAASKPFGFMPFYPGPGLGGHCIPVDPHYLVWKLRAMNYNPRFIQVADEVNSAMPQLVVDKVTEALNSANKSVKDANILVLGVAYKSDIDDSRESPALDVMHLLKKRGGNVKYHDPFVPTVRCEGEIMESVEIDKGVAAYDCVAILTNHSMFDIKKIADQAKLIVDTRNATKLIRGASEKIFKI